MNVALITGACGGIGRPCARDLGRSHALVLTDIEPRRLDAFADALREEGHTVASVVAADLAAPGVAEQVVAQARAAGPLTAVAHTAGLSPSLAGWDAIMAANVVATERLLLALEDGLEAELAAVLMASIAAHLARPDPELDRQCIEPLDAGFLARTEPRLAAIAAANPPLDLAAAAYNQSKRYVLRTCAMRCPAWAAQGARIVSVSPGTIWTPMGRKEIEDNAGAAMVKDLTPLKRWGRPGDIADAVAFLLSDRASFITGTDLRVDGGVVSVLVPA